MEFRGARGGLNHISCNLKHFQLLENGEWGILFNGWGGGVVWIATPSNMTFSNAIFVRGFVGKSEMS